MARDQIEERLERIEHQLEQSATGGKSRGCLGFALLAYIVYLLHRVLDKLGS